MRSIEDTLKRTGLSKIDIAYIHDADDRIGEAIEKSYPVLSELRSQGVLSGIGVGMNYCAPSVRAKFDGIEVFALEARPDQKQP